jgi:hypothetical protein
MSVCITVQQMLMISNWEGHPLHVVALKMPINLLFCSIITYFVNVSLCYILFKQNPTSCGILTIVILLF